MDLNIFLGADIARNTLASNRLERADRSVGGNILQATQQRE